MAGRGIGRVLGLLALVAGLAACSQPTPPPRGAAGMAFGDPPPDGLAAVAVPLPDAVAGRLRFYARPDRAEAFLGVVLAEPVLAFFDGRFFSVSGSLAGPDAMAALRERLTRAYGPGYCRDAAKLAVCLWRGGDVDMVLEGPQGGPWRFMARYRPLADLVAGAVGPDRGGPVEGASDPVPVVGQ